MMNELVLRCLICTANTDCTCCFLERKNGGQKVLVDVHYRILSDIDDESPDMDTCFSMQQAGQETGAVCANLK